MALFRGIQEYITRDANNIANNIVSISGNIFLYPPQGHPIIITYLKMTFCLFTEIIFGINGKMMVEKYKSHRLRLYG